MKNGVMKRLSRYVWLLAFLFVAMGVAAQQLTVSHKVKKKETIYGIARDYGITIEQLMQANPGMESPDYQLKKGTIIQIPVIASGPQADAGSVAPVTSSGTADDVRSRSIRLGVMLPLHQSNNDGKRMVEYYRGVLMACDSVKKEGISVDVYAWNLPENGNVKALLDLPEARNCDMVIGPFYSKYMSVMSAFADDHDVLLVVPFSIHAPEVYSNRNIFQIYQTPNDLTESTARRCAEWFKDSHIIVVDCADSTSTKGAFTAMLRRQLEVADRRYSLTSLKSSDANFAAAFVKDQPNVVVLNSARSRDLLAAFGRLSAIKASQPEVQISMFGYTEWLAYAQQQAGNFHKYGVYVPSPFYTNLLSPQTEAFQRRYRACFRQEMLPSLPRFALSGFDHALFFLRGLHKYGKAFDGAGGRFGYQPIQTPLKFERVGNGGLQNRSYMFIHYKPDYTIETINY